MKEKRPLWPEDDGLHGTAERQVRARAWVAQMHKLARWSEFFFEITPLTELEEFRDDLDALWKKCPAECRPPPEPPSGPGWLEVLGSISEERFDPDKALKALAEAGVEPVL